MTLVCQFVPFKYAVDVCDTCGRLLSEHPGEHTPDDLTKAMWKVLLTDGGLWSFYGGGFIPAECGMDRGVAWRNEMAKIQLHMEACEIDWKRTEAPEMSEMSEFAGTFNESDKVERLCGVLFCKCRELAWKRIGINGITLGQLIWKVVHADD